MERVAALDLLRGVAALSVAIPHFVMLNSASDPAEIVSVLAVEVFFVLSGFVLGPQILRCLRSGQAGDLGVFLARRWMRTIPPYLFALALMSVIVGHVELADLARYALYVENLFAQDNVTDYFPVAWSLSIEEWFYIAFPGLLMIAAWRLRNNRDGFAVLVALGFIGTITVLRQLFGNLDDWGPSVRRVVAFRVEFDRLRVPALHGRAAPCAACIAVACGTVQSRSGCNSLCRRRFAGGRADMAHRDGA